MTHIIVTVTGEEAQYLLNAMDTHIKTHGLKVAPGGVTLLMKLQAAASEQAVDESASEESEEPAD